MTPGCFQATHFTYPYACLFIARMARDGSRLLWGTYLGGTSLPEDDYPGGVALDFEGNVYVSGKTNSRTFPTTPGTFLSQYPWGPTATIITGFVSKLSKDGTALLASTLITDPNSTFGNGMGDLSVDPSGVVTSHSWGHPTFPVTPGAYDTSCDTTFGENVLLRLGPDFDRLFYATFLGAPVGNSMQKIVVRPDGGMLAGAGHCQDPGGWPVTTNASQGVFPGGGSSGVVTLLDLQLQGLALSGTSRPSCLGPVRIGATKMPAAGSAHFSVYASTAPPSTLGWLAIARPGASLGVVGGAGLWDYHLAQLVPVQTDARGFVETSLPLPAGTAGTQMQLRYVFRGTATCGQASSTCWSPSLSLTVQ